MEDFFSFKIYFASNLNLIKNKRMTQRWEDRDACEKGLILLVIYRHNIAAQPHKS